MRKGLASAVVFTCGLLHGLAAARGLAGPPAVAPGHPRIFLRAPDVAALRERCGSVEGVREPCAALRQAILGGAALVSDATAAGAAEDLTAAVVAWTAGEPDPRLLERARRLAGGLFAAEPDPASQAAVLRALSLAYDGLHGALAPEERARWGGRLAERARKALGSSAGAPAGADSIARIALLYPALALAGDGIDDDLASEALAEAEKALKESLIPAANRLAARMAGAVPAEPGSSPGALAREVALALEAWRTGTGEDLFPSAPGLRAAAAWMLLATPPGDLGAALERDGACLPLIAARSRDGRAQRAAQLAAPGGVRLWPRVLWHDPALEAAALDSLPACAFLPGIGQAAVRGSSEPGAAWALFDGAGLSVARGGLLLDAAAPEGGGEARIAAYEDNASFAFTAGGAPSFTRRVVLLKPSLLVIEDRLRPPGAGAAARWSLRTAEATAIEGSRARIGQGEDEVVLQALLPAGTALAFDAARRAVALVPREGPGSSPARTVWLLRAGRRGEPAPSPEVAEAEADGELRLAVAWGGRTYRLGLPARGAGGGEIGVTAAGGEAIVERRLLPSGVLQRGLDVAGDLERWDSAYRDGRRPPWDTGRPSSELRAAVERDDLRPCRAVELGCGTGTNVVFLASRGFDATGIDIAPTALERARRKAREAGARASFVLADVLAPPELEPFDLVFDRGCYHGLRRGGAAEYLEALRRLTRPGARVLLLAGNANEPPPHYGPPRVKEEELRGDLGGLFAFERLVETRFDTQEPSAKGALSWSALLVREEGLRPATLDLREPTALGARAIARRLDPAAGWRPWFLIRGVSGIPARPEHASWDLGDMTGRYLESLVQARRMGVAAPELSEAEGRLGKNLLAMLGSDGLVHDPATGAADHPFSQGSAFYALVAWLEDSGDPAVRDAAQRLVAGLLRSAERREGKLVVPAAKLPESSGSHLAGYGIWPAVRLHEITGSPDALQLAEGLARWVLEDPVLAPDGAIAKPLSWEGHIHSWLDALAGCARAARWSKTLDRARTLERCRAAYDWVRRTNATAFGWIATYPTGGSSETCAISSAVRLALELAASGEAKDLAYLGDVERFARNQAVEAQFRDPGAYAGGPEPPSPLLLGSFDSQSMPNGHLGTRGGEDVGTVEGCCTNGGLRVLALAWDAVLSSDEAGVTVNLRLSRDGPAAEVIGYEPHEGRVDVIPRSPGSVRIRAPDWARREDLSVAIDGAPASWTFEAGYVVVARARAGSRVSLRYPLRELEETVTAGGQDFRVRWRGDTVVAVDPPGAREPAYRGRAAGPGPAPLAPSAIAVPDGHELRDAARLASSSMLARLDLERSGQPFFRIYPFATPPRAEHEKWDDGDMSGRYVEALILARRMTGMPPDPRERLLRRYFAGLFDASDGLAYTREAPWTPRRACLFSQSCAMLGLLAWRAETGSPEALRLLDRHVDGLLKIAAGEGPYASFPKYEHDGTAYADDPKGRDAPAWYGGRLILPLVELWKLSGREEARVLAEKLARYSMEVNGGVKPDGEVRGNGWWGHLHSTMDMAAGICELGRLTGRPEWPAWARRVHDWIGRTHANRYGWVSDAVGSPVCESCAIASRIRLSLALRRAGLLEDPFGEIDRYLRNQLLESQFTDASFLAPLEPDRPRTERATYRGVDRMVLGTFQCWGTANDLIGHDDIEGCGAGGGVQALALAWDAQSEWVDGPGGKELYLHLLFNRRIRGPAEPPLTTGTPVAAELWSWLPREGRVEVVAHRAIPRVSLRLPDGVGALRCRVRRGGDAAGVPAELEGRYALVRGAAPGERIELHFPLEEYETVEQAQGKAYRVRWKGSAVLSIDPPGARIPLYARRASYRGQAPLSGPRYP
ncbi:MAG: methyltransferase domain-containing protein [Planctomycetes bacterium]|nr:methyltransferase domain-containing protein [Planctomycetota bacterium]